MKSLNRSTSRLSWVWAVLCLGFLTLFAPFGSRDTLAASHEYCVDDFGAKADDSKDDTDAIVEALKKSMDTNTLVTITFNSGVYLINRPMYVYPDTHIILKDDTTLRATANYNNGKGGTMFYGVHLNDEGWECFSTTGCNHAGYSQCHDVTIEGGIYDGNWANQSARNSMMIFRHATGITLKNATLTHFTSHVVNISGTQDVLISDVTFKDCEKYSGTQSIYYNTESIHFDYISENGENAYPPDGTAPKNVVIRNCVFDNVKGGVGTHHPADDKSKVAENVHILGCDFRGIAGKYCVGFGECRNCSIENCIYPTTSTLGYKVELVRRCASNASDCHYTETGNVCLDPSDDFEVLRLNHSSAKLYSKGDEAYRTLTLKANLSGVSYRSSNESVASVTQDGVVNGLSKGTAVITASVETNGIHQEASCSIEVLDPTLTVSPKKMTLSRYSSKQLKVSATPAGTITYKSSKKSVASVSSTGLIKAKKKGSAKITVSCNGIKVKVKVTVR